MGRKNGGETGGMLFPVRCAHCSQVYDVGAVTVTKRYPDSSVWDAPCCGATVDDREPIPWSRRAHFKKLGW